MTDNAALRIALGCQTRTFRTVKGAMLWYRDALAAKLRTSRALEFGTTPRSRDSIHQANATFAAIANCLKGVQHAAWLVSWYETTHGDGTWLADQAGISRWAFTRRCRKTERALREKLKSAGVLEE